MSELDFDELDKAVNTLMSDAPKTPLSKTDDIKTLNINSTLPDMSRPSLDQLDTALTEVNSSVATRSAIQRPALSTPPPSLATRRSGRFMDVVHPSSNMKSTPRPVIAPSRQGVAIQPDEKLLTAMSNDQTDVVQPELVTEVSQNTTAEPSFAPASSVNNDWPDPLEMSGYEAEPRPNAEVVPAVVVASVPEAALPSESDSDDELFTIDGLDERDSQPLNSPFIADAKVEKRPLGGSLVEDDTEELSRAPVLGVLVDDTSAPTDPNDQLPVTPAELEIQLPPELQSDLMAIETDGGTSAAPNVEKDDSGVVAQPPASATVVPAVSVAPEAKAAAVPVAATGPTSIPQQYHEEQSTSDQSNGSIYDTDSYHQPLAHPAKTKSGWLWVIWILLLLIVGGGGAVALYFLGII